jgi:hypothetical protein
MLDNRDLIIGVAEKSSSRFDLWVQLLKKFDTVQMVEVGVYRGDFAKIMLENVQAIRNYYLLDPWRNLNDWNKPANKSDEIFDEYLTEVKFKVRDFRDRVTFLRGKTSEVIHNIDDQSLDFAYIDGDHTLKGITIDLINVFPKIKEGGWIGGDDFTRSIWQHASSYEPSLVFPFSVYFAEAVGCRIISLPHSQFLIIKDTSHGYEYINHLDDYSNTALKQQLGVRRQLSLKAKELAVSLYRLAVSAFR